MKTRNTLIHRRYYQLYLSQMRIMSRIGSYWKETCPVQRIHRKDAHFIHDVRWLWTFANLSTRHSRKKSQTIMLLAIFTRRRERKTSFRRTVNEDNTKNVEEAKRKERC